MLHGVCNGFRLSKNQTRRFLRMLARFFSLVFSGVVMVFGLPILMKVVTSVGALGMIFAIVCLVNFQRV